MAVTFEIGMQSGCKSLLDVYKGKYRLYTMTLYRAEVQRRYGSRILQFICTVYIPRYSGKRVRHETLFSRVC